MNSFRLTLDLDSTTQKKALSKFRLLRAVFPRNEMQLRQSSSGTGYHIIVYDACQSFRESLAWRKWLGDDRKRLAYDSMRHRQGICSAILFSEKEALTACPKRAKRLV